MLKKIKDSFANMYESEILNLNSDEFRTLSFLRVKAGENGVLWYSKDAIREKLKLGRDKINKILNNLEDHGAIIIFNAKDNKTKKNASNVYYLSEYDPIKKRYMTANTIGEIKTHALEIRQKKEIEYAVKNNLNPRQLILEERLPKEVRKIKFYIHKPCTEIQYVEPCTEIQYVEPCTEIQYIINNKNNLNNKKQVNNNNNKNEEDFKTVVVVNEDIINLVKNYIESNLTKITKEEAGLLINDFISVEKEFDFDIFKTRIDTIKNYKGKINNIVAMLRVAIRKSWSSKDYQNKNNKKDSFTDYEQRNYDFDELEKKLLGW